MTGATTIATGLKGERGLIVGIITDAIIPVDRVKSTWLLTVAACGLETAAR